MPFTMTTAQMRDRATADSETRRKHGEKPNERRRRSSSGQVPPNDRDPPLLDARRIRARAEGEHADRLSAHQIRRAESRTYRPAVAHLSVEDRKSTRLNSSH